ncbi:MAG: hypothetical protein Fur0026_00140 [Sideroxydans sp.]
MATSKKASAATTTRKTAGSKTATEQAAVKKTAAAAKPASKVSTPKTATSKKTAPAVAKAAAPVAKAVPRKTAAAAPSAEERYRMVQDAAYYLAEKDGFKGGAMDYWIAAEAQITVLLSGK